MDSQVESLGQFHQIFTEWKVINCGISNNIKIRSLDGQKIHLIYCERPNYEKFKHEIIKEDREKKIQFFNTFLFCGKTASFPVSSISISNFQRGKEILPQMNQIMIIYKGCVTLHLASLTNPKEKWKFTLVRGGFITIDLLL